MTPNSDTSLPPCVVTQRGLLGGWLCASPEATDADLITSARKLNDLDVPDALVLDRLFGGFRCGDYPERRHIYYAIGWYTFLNPSANEPMTPADRAAVWAELMEDEGNRTGPGRFIGGGPCCADAPNVQEPA